MTKEATTNPKACTHRQLMETTTAYRRCQAELCGRKIVTTSLV